MLVHPPTENPQALRILIISDAWKPQTNGVVRTYEALGRELEAAGHAVRVVGPRDFRWRMPMPGYHEIELVLFPGRRLRRILDEFAPDTIHLATEGPLGQAARTMCRHRAIPYTSCFHTLFPDYAATRAAKLSTALFKPVKSWFIRKMRNFHNESSSMMIASSSLEALVREWGFTCRMDRLTRGADLTLYGTERKDIFADLKQPVAIYIGRVALEKNLDAFLSMAWEGSKVIVGDGPDRARLEAAYPDAIFTGVRTGMDLAAHYQSADVFVFPSRTDTFGMVLVEALACGLPVAAYPVPGPADIVTDPLLGSLHDDLAVAAARALNTPGSRDDRHRYVAGHYSWSEAARQFLAAIESSQAVIKS